MVGFVLVRRRSHSSHLRTVHSWWPKHSEHACVLATFHGSRGKGQGDPRSSLSPCAPLSKAQGAWHMPALCSVTLFQSCPWGTHEGQLLWRTPSGHLKLRAVSSAQPTALPTLLSACWCTQPWGCLLGQGAAAEAQTGLTFRQQAAALPADRAALCALILVASLIPISKGAISEPFGVFTPRAERVNSRAAMLAIAVLVWLEAQSGTPFF